MFQCVRDDSINTDLKEIRVKVFFIVLVNIEEMADNIVGELYHKL